MCQLGAEPSENYSDFINRKVYFSTNIQAVCHYTYCLQYVVVKCTGCVHDARIFLNSSISGMLRKRTIPPCEKILVEGIDPVPVSLLGDPACPFLCIFNERIFWRWKKWKEKFFSYKLSSARIPFKNLIGRLKARFRCLQRAVDTKLDTLPQVIYSCFVLNNYYDK